MANHELYVVQGKTLDNIAGTMRAVLGVDKDAPIRFDEVANSDKTEQISTDVETQTDLIVQIKTALEGKAAGGGGTEELENLIDQSGVLDSTEGTVEDKVERLIELSTEEKMWIELTENKPNADYFFKSAVAEKLPKTNFINATSANQFCAFSKIKEVDYYLNFCNCGNLYESFRECSIKTIKGINCEKTTSLAGAFKSSALVTIEEPLNVQNVTTFGMTFYNCRSLVNIRFVEETIHYSIEFPQSEKLSVESRQSIFDGLATVETVQTLTLNANLKILQSQVDSANAKGWTVAGGTVVSEEEYYG